MFTMGFITPCWKNWASKCVLLLVLFWASLALPAWAQGSGVEFTQFKLEKTPEQLQLSSAVQFELAPPVEEALLKGVPLFFVVEADLLRERWYWMDRKVAHPSRHMRLSFQPLTRRWRLAWSQGPFGAATQNALSQNFETLPDALSAVRRLSGWPLTELAELDPGAKYRLELRFYLDLAQLPRPLQIGALGQSDWNLNATLTYRFTLDGLK